jgi:solute carrier family 25 aspartate/glutamate transporter 12/13
VKRGALHIIRELGLLGLYKGATACLLRFVAALDISTVTDHIPQGYTFFCCKVTPNVEGNHLTIAKIYFTSYSHLKKDVFHEGYNNKKLSFVETLSAAAIA